MKRMDFESDVAYREENLKKFTKKHKGEYVKLNDLVKLLEVNCVDRIFRQILIDSPSETIEEFISVYNYLKTVKRKVLYNSADVIEVGKQYPATDFNVEEELKDGRLYFAIVRNNERGNDETD